MRPVARIAVAACVVAALGAVGLFGTEYFLDRRAAAQESEGGGDGGQRATRVGVASPKTRVVEDAVDAVGTVTPRRRVELRPTVSGRVTEVGVDSGQRVEAGDLIVQLDDRAQRARLAGAEATLEEARQNLNRIEELADSNTVANQQLEEARATFGRAESDVLAAQAALEDRRIEAPFAGTLGLVSVDAGAYLSPQDVIAPLSDLSVVQVDMALPERYFGRVSRGQTVDLTVPAYPDQEFEGTVTVREAGIDEASRSFDVRAEIDNPDRMLVGGMFAQSRLVFDTDEGLAVPDDAIISEGSVTYVYTVADGQAQRQEITTGASIGALTEVVEGLSADDRVVVSGWNTLRDGASVTVAEDIAREGLE
ncbi:efflux RND transporter periplasmic adaptor subunit [Citreimonas sp.]|uniref:efflux RND transporter periplasmic adaptor subunit n=1 Tax=Citreimonas sp. TaxID=3036715 RepID=UPI0035C8097D